MRTASATRSPSHACSHHQVSVTWATQSAITSASASAPRLQSAISAYSSGECDTPVGLRTNSIAVGTFSDSTPASCPAAVGRIGTSPSADKRAHDPRAWLLGEDDGGADGLDVHRQRDRVVLGESGRIGGDRLDHGRQRRLVGGARVEPGLNLRRNGVGAVGGDGQLAERRHRLVRGGTIAGGAHRRRERQHRIAAVDQSRGARVVAHAAERELPPAVRPDRRGHRDGLVHQIQRASLFDVQFDVDTDALGQVRVGAEVRRIRGRRQSAPRPAWCRRRRAASARASGVTDPVDSCDPTQATPKRPPSSSENATTATGIRGTTPRATSRSMAANADTMPSGPSNAPPPGTESRCEPVTKAPDRVTDPVRAASTTPTRCRCGPPRPSCRAAVPHRRTTPAASDRRWSRRIGGSRRWRRPARRRGSNSHSASNVIGCPAWEFARRVRRRPGRRTRTPRRRGG